MACHQPRGSVMHVLNAWVVSSADPMMRFQVEDTFKVGADSVHVDGLLFLLGMLSLSWDGRWDLGFAGKVYNRFLMMTMTMMVTPQLYLHMWGRKSNETERKLKPKVITFLHAQGHSTCLCSSLRVLYLFISPGLWGTVLRDNIHHHAGVSQKADLHLLVNWGNQGLCTWPS